MNVAPEIAPETDAEAEAVDVLIVGAGISGVDAGRHLRRERPGTSFLIIDRADGVGGTWRTHRFPGIRSDSDLYTFGFAWKPWLGKTLATGDEILAYLDEAVAEEGLAPHMRFGCALVSANWSEAARRWTAVVETAGARRRVVCRFLWMCQGYYDHLNGYVPAYQGRERFAGPVLHPQHWPEDQEIAGKRIAVIGSGATAATLVPALADEGASVTVVQRSPTYYFPRPREHELAALIRPLDLPPEWFHEIMRRRALADQAEVRRRSLEEPEALREELLDAARAYLGDACPVEPHFSPRYRVWRQRLAVAPEGDLFRAIRRGAVKMVTGEIESFTETGLALSDGGEVEADVIVSATGLNLQMMGGAAISVDGRPHDFSTSWTYWGMMFSDLPNLAWTFGYVRASWTLRADLVSGFVARLLGHMEATGAEVAEPRLRPEDADMPALPLFDPEDFNPGYITRALPIMPRGGDRPPWRFTQDYPLEREAIPKIDFTDGAIDFR